MDARLLRDFNKKDIEDGATLLRYSSEEVCIGEETKYIAGPDRADDVVTLDMDSYLWIYDSSSLKIKPVAELEGKPVYPGDTFWLSWDNMFYQLRIESFENTSIAIDTPITFSIRQHITTIPIIELLKNCSWTRPKQKKEGWVNAYSWMNGEDYSLGGPYTSKEIADQKGSITERTDCVRITWEE